MGKEDFSGPVYSVGKALALLEEISNHPDGIGLNDISEMFKLEKSSVFRILETLENNGFVIKSANPVRYTLGLKLFRLGLRKQEAMPFRRAAIPFLKELRISTGETAVAATIESYDMFYLEADESSAVLKCGVDLRGSRPDCRDALGKMLLANKDDAFLDKFFQSHPPARTAAGIKMSLAEIKRELREADKAGVAVDHGGREVGVHGVAVPVFRPDRIPPSAAIGLVYPASRHNRAREKELTEMLKRVSERLSQAAYYSK